MQPTLFCIVCGRPIQRYVPPSRLAKGHGKYCSQACAGIARRADDSPEALLGRLYERSQRTADGCLEWAGPRKPDGYGVLGKINSRTYAVHRLGYELLKGPITPGLCVLHHCDNPPCWEPEHLFLGSRTVNNLDRDAKGRFYHRLASTEVAEIKAALTGCYGNQAALARKYGVSAATINAIAKGNTWRNVA